MKIKSLQISNIISFAHVDDIANAPKVTFDKNNVTFVVTDQGPGFENPIQQIKRQHGLYEVEGYADQMIIETNGKKYIKEPNTWGIALSKEKTDIKQGSRITFTKKYDQTVEEN